MEDKFDAIIVGGGVAGATAALLLARAGLETVVVERGNYSGAKNMTGGRLYSHSLEQVIPGFAGKAPLERKVARERITFMTGDAATTLDYTSPEIQQPGKDSYTVLRGVFDRWLMEQAEEAGAMPVTGIRVDDFVCRDGRIAGIVAGGEEMLSDVVILADGANSLLVEKSGLRKSPPSPHEMAVGAKEILELDPKLIEDRFNLNPGEGAAWLFAGFPSGGMTGGGLIYTNKDSVSIGLVATLSGFRHNASTVGELMEAFKNHPAVKPLIAGGKLAEYSGHMVPEGGYDMVPTLCADGVLVTGDAAGLVINAGYTVRGMDLAVGSAVAAARSVVEAKEKGDFSAGTLGRYRTLLDESFVMKELKHFRKFPRFMENPRIFNDYPQMVGEMMANVFTVDGSVTPMRKKLLGPARKVDLMKLIGDGIKGMMSL